MNQEQTSIPTPNDVKYIQDTLYAVGGKWKLPILHCLSTGSLRFGDLKQRMPGITSRMLSKELKELELNGFIKRDPRHAAIEYVVEDYCQSFGNIIQEMIRWGKQHRQFIARNAHR